MSDLFSRTLAKLYEPAYVSQGTNFTGVDINTFQKKTGSRMQLAVSIHSIDGGATLNVTLENAATLVDPVYATALNQNYTTAGVDTRILLDLNRYCLLTVTVSGGAATYSVVVTLVDNASSEDYATETTLQEVVTALDAIAGGASLRQQIVNAPDSNATYTWADFGTTQERVLTIVYTSPTFPLNTVTRAFTYSSVGGKYKLDTDIWSVT